MNVSLARRWARLGCIVLRMDLAGLGESDPRPGRPVDEVFPPEAIEDIRAAIDYLRAACGCGDITLAGLCSGAYHALRAAIAGLAIERVLLVNPQIYFWREGTRMDDLQLIEVVRGPSRYRERLLSARSWGKLLRGRADVRHILRVMAEHVWFLAGAALRNCARRAHIRLAHDLAEELRRSVARGVRIVFVFARGEVGLELLKIQAGACLDRLGERCRIHVIDGADHIFSQSKPRQVLENILTAELLEAHPAPGGLPGRRPDADIARVSATAVLP